MSETKTQPIFFHFADSNDAELLQFFELSHRETCSGRNGKGDNLFSYMTMLKHGKAFFSVRCACGKGIILCGVGNYATPEFDGVKMALAFNK